MMALIIIGCIIGWFLLGFLGLAVGVGSILFDRHYKFTLKNIIKMALKEEMIWTVFAGPLNFLIALIFWVIAAFDKAYDATCNWDWDE